MADTLDLPALSLAARNLSFLDDFITESVADSLIAPGGETWVPLPKWFSGVEADAGSKVDSIAAGLSSAATVYLGSMADALSGVDAAADAATLDMASIVDVVSGAAVVAQGSINDAVSAVDAAGSAATLDMSSIVDALSLNLQSAHDVASLDMESIRDGISGQASLVGNSVAAELANVKSAAGVASADIGSAVDAVRDEHLAFSAVLSGLETTAHGDAAGTEAALAHIRESYSDLIEVKEAAWEKSLSDKLQELNNSAHTELYDVVTTGLATLAAYEAVAAGAAGPFLPYDSVSELTADLSPVADKLALVKSNLTLYRKIGGSGAGSWDVFAVLKDGCHSRDFGIVANGYSGSPTNQAAAAEVMYAAAIAAGHRKAIFDPPTTPGEAYLINKWSALVDSIDLEVHPDAVIQGTNNVPHPCTRQRSAEIYLPTFARETIRGGGDPRDKYMHQPDAIFAWSGLLYASYHYNPISNEEGAAGQVIEMQRREAGGSWTNIGSPWYDGETATNPWTPSTNGEVMQQAKFAWFEADGNGGQELWMRQVTGRGSSDNGLMISKQFAEGGDWTNYFLWFPDAGGAPVLTTDLTAPSGHSHTVTIGGVAYHPYAPGGNLVTDAGRIIIYLSLTPASGGNNNATNKIHRPIYSDDRGTTWHWAPAVAPGDLEPYQLWEMRAAKIVGGGYIAMCRVNSQEGTVADLRGRRHAVTYSQDGVHWTPWRFLAANLPLETVCPVPLNATHIGYPSAAGRVRRTAQSLCLLRHPFNAVVQGPRASAEEMRGENYQRYPALASSSLLPDDTLFTLDFDAQGMAERFRGRGKDSEWTIFDASAGDYSLTQASPDTIEYLAGDASPFNWFEYRELTGELAMVSCMAVNYATGEIVMIWSQNRQADAQVGGTEIVVASTFDLPKPDRVNVMPTDAAEIYLDEEGHDFTADLINNKLTLHGGAFASCDLQIDDTSRQFHFPFSINEAPAGAFPAVVGVLGNAEQNLVCDIDADDEGEYYQRVRYSSGYDNESDRGRVRPLSTRALPALTNPYALSLRIDGREGRALFQDRVDRELDPRITLMLGDGLQTTVPPTTRQLVFDLAAASIMTMPAGFGEPAVAPAAAVAPNVITDPWWSLPALSGASELLVAGKFFAPNWRCVTTGGAVIRVRKVLNSVEVALEDSGGEQEYLRFEVDGAGDGNFIIEHVFPDLQTLNGLPYTLQGEIAELSADFGQVVDRYMQIDWAIYPNGTLYAPQLDSLTLRIVRPHWSGFDAWLPLPLWEGRAEAPPSQVESSAGLRFGLPADAAANYGLRFLDMWPGVGRRPFVKPPRADVQARVGHVVQVVQAARPGSVLARGRVHDNGDGSWTFRAGLPLSQAMRRAPDVTFQRAFAVRGRSGAAVITETFSPTLTDRRPDHIEIGCDTLTGASWSDGQAVDLVGLSTLSETLLGDGASTVLSLAQIDQLDARALRVAKVNAGSGTEALSLTAGDFLFDPPGTRLHAGPFTGDGSRVAWTYNEDIGPTTQADVALWNGSTESLLAHSEYDAVAPDPNDGTPGTLTVNATPASGVLVDLRAASEVDWRGRVNFLGPVASGDTMFVEDSGRGASRILLEAYPRFQGQRHAVTAAFLATLSTPMTVQLQEALDSFLSRLVEWGLFAKLDALQLYGLHNLTDSLRDVVDSGRTITITGSGGQTWQRHYGISMYGSTDAGISTGYTPGSGVYVQDSATVFCLAQRVIAAAGGYLWGSSGNLSQYVPDFSGAVHQLRLNNNTNDSSVSIATDHGYPSFHAATRNDGTNVTQVIKGQRGSFGSRTIALASTGIPSGQFFVNRNGSSYGRHDVLLWGAGSGMTEEELELLALHCHEFRRRLGEVPHYDS